MRNSHCFNNVKFSHKNLANFSLPKIAKFICFCEIFVFSVNADFLLNPGYTLTLCYIALI